MFDKKEYMAKYYKNNKDKMTKQHNIWLLEHPKYNEEHCRNWRKEHPKYDREHYEIFKKNNPEYGKEQYKNHKKRMRKIAKQWAKDNPKRRLDITKKYQKTDKGKANHQRCLIKRRSRENKIINTLTIKEWFDILKEYDYKCAYCGCDFDENTLPTRDHIIPISKDGNNTKENIVPACRSCNSKKYVKILKKGEIL